MAVIVQKFGGSSVADERGREQAVKKIKAELDSGNKPVVVVSAMGRRGAPYATDTFLDLVPGAGAELSALIVSCGETISACVMAHCLNTHGIPAKALTAYTAGIMASGPYDGAEPADINTANLEALLEAGVVPVVTGFQGVLPDLSLATLGRGGSDTSAVALGARLKAAYVDIFTDVPGVAMADPRIAPDAPFLPFLDYDSMLRLSANGNRVLHDRSAKIAMEKNVLIRIRSTFDDKPGTLIGPCGSGAAPDLAGITVKDKDGETSILTLVFRKDAGRGKADRLLTDQEQAGRRSADRELADRGHAGCLQAGHGKADKELADQGRAGCLHAEQGQADRGRAGPGRAGKIAGQLGVMPLPGGDPDIAIFELPKAGVKTALETILAPYIKQA